MLGVHFDNERVLQVVMCHADLVSGQGIRVLSDSLCELPHLSSFNAEGNGNSRLMYACTWLLRVVAFERCCVEDCLLSLRSCGSSVQFKMSFW